MLAYTSCKLRYADLKKKVRPTCMHTGEKKYIVSLVVFVAYSGSYLAKGNTAAFHVNAFCLL